MSAHIASLVIVIAALWLCPSWACAQCIQGSGHERDGGAVETWTEKRQALEQMIGVKYIDKPLARDEALRPPVCVRSAPGQKRRSMRMETR